MITGKTKIIRITTVPLSLKKLLGGQLAFMSQNGFDITAISSPGHMLNEVGKKEGVKTKGIKLTRKITPIADTVALVKLVSLLLKERPMIVHTHTPKAGLIGMLAARIAGIPIRMHTVAGMPLLESKGIKRSILNLTEKLTYTCATKVYPNSNKLLDIIVENNLCDSSKVKVIGLGSSNGINTSVFSPFLFNKESNDNLRSKLNIKPVDKVLIFIGRVVGDKGIRELITAFLKQVEKDKNLKLLVVGPFERNLDALDKKTEEAILHHPNIKFLDYQDDVRPYLAISDLFVFPSYREGFPNVVMQAGAMGVPCIVSDINGCNEIIEQGINGLIVPAKDAVALEKAITYLIDDEQMLLQMASKSRQMIVDRFDQQFVWKELLKEYHSLQEQVLGIEYASKVY